MTLMTVVASHLLMAGIVAPTECQLPADRAQNTDWFSQAGWGVFVHYLWDCQVVGERVANTGGPADWDAAIRAFDTERFAEGVARSGAHYCIFTMHQRTRYLIAPNATFDRLTGYKPGEACSTRDLVEDLYQSLNKRGVKLMLYWTGDGPRQDEKAAKALGYAADTPAAFVRNWASVVAEYGERYRDKVLGWWVDGCYGFSGYNEEKWSILAAGLRAGNPRRIIALNNPKMNASNSSTLNDDYTTGEQNTFGEVPRSRWCDGVQWHILSYLGNDWCTPGLRYDSKWLAEYVGRVNRAGGVVTIDLLLYRDGMIERSHVETLRRMTERLEWIKHRQPVPPGNLACYRPARLLSLDGSHELGPSGSGSEARTADFGNDGDPNTVAQAGGEYAWTYEVDLEQAQPLRRVVVRFGRAVFATEFAVALSADGRSWQEVGSRRDHDGSATELTFDPVAARYVRVLGRKPDGEGQRGGQMAITELECYR
ncbi:MAG: discoidin domain-containing protein [Armatimonadetes bacterium]|nr:discoidin domain-containing protein [Armatimonadota bacterium]